MLPFCCGVSLTPYEAPPWNFLHMKRGLAFYDLDFAGIEAHTEAGL